MKAFAEHITESASKNTHMTHIEDKVLYGGVNGTRQAIFALRDLRDLLAGHGGKVSVKWDGAPAVFAGTDPSDGKFFVAKKGIFNKNPKVYKTDADIDDDTSGDLNVKLKEALKYLSKLNIKGVIQGDFLFGGGDRKIKAIEGKKYLTFHPNTIVYAVPVENAAEIRNAKIGIVWHTTYTGSTFESMKASYGVDVKALNKSPAVWSVDAILTDATNATMTKTETADVNSSLSKIGKLFNKISGSTLRQLESNQVLASHLETFHNSLIRQGVDFKSKDAKWLVSQSIKFIQAKYSKEIAKRKSAAGKATQQKKLDELLKFFSEDNRTNLVLMYNLMKQIIIVKLKLINKLNRLQNIDTFVKTKNGYKVTGAEGFVAIDKLGGDAVKIVDRMEFSQNNFSADILKGWDKSGR